MDASIFIVRTSSSLHVYCLYGMSAILAGVRDVNHQGRCFLFSFIHFCVRFLSVYVLSNLYFLMHGISSTQADFVFVLFCFSGIHL